MEPIPLLTRIEDFPEDEKKIIKGLVRDITTRTNALEILRKGNVNECIEQVEESLICLLNRGVLKLQFEKDKEGRVRGYRLFNFNRMNGQYGCVPLKRRGV